MDDDAPLSALAKGPKFDDDTPLASLADVGKSRAGPKAGAKAGGSPAAKGPPKGSPKAGAAAGKGKGRGKGTPTKRKGSSSSSSSSDSDDSSSSDSDDKSKPKGKKPIVKGKKPKLLQKAQTAEDGLEANDGGGAVKKRDRTVKEQVAADLLCRWWYALPDWPPQDNALYQAALAKRSFRKVTIEEWEWVPEEKDGLKKCYELSQFRGLFRASNGDLIDVRPQETCPCYANFVKKDLPELYDLLVSALENQMKELKKSKYNETQLEQELKVKLTSTREKAYQAKQLSGAAKKGGRTG